MVLEIPRRGNTFKYKVYVQRKCKPLLTSKWYKHAVINIPRACAHDRTSNTFYHTYWFNIHILSQLLTPWMKFYYFHISSKPLMEILQTIIGIPVFRTYCNATRSCVRRIFLTTPDRQKNMNIWFKENFSLSELFLPDLVQSWGLLYVYLTFEITIFEWNDSSPQYLGIWAPQIFGLSSSHGCNLNTV